MSLYQVALQKEGPMHLKHPMWNFYGNVYVASPLVCYVRHISCLSYLQYDPWIRSVKRETLKLIETFLDKAEDQPQIGKQFVPPMMDPVLGDYARNLPDARESEVLSLFATIINKYAIFFSWCWLCNLPCILFFR